MSHFITNDRGVFISSVQLVLFVISLSAQLSFVIVLFVGFLNSFLKIHFYDYS